MGLRSKLRERQAYKDDPLDQHAPSFAPFDQDAEQVAPSAPADADAAITGLGDNTTWLVDLSSALLGENEEEPDPTGADLASEEPPPVWLPNDTEPSPLDKLPAGAVRNRDDVYADGNRCNECGVATTLDVCIGCTTGTAA